MLLGDEPIGPGLDQGSGGANAVPEVRQDVERAAFGSHINTKTSEPEAARFPDLLEWGALFEIARPETGRGDEEVHAGDSLLS